MSAFVVDPVHIDLILSTAINGPRDRRGAYDLTWGGPYVDGVLPGRSSGPISNQVADAVGQALLIECITSVSHRYPDDRPDQLPGIVPGFDPRSYEWTDFGRPMTAIEGCKAIDCYEYQSCEHPSWSISGVRAFCERLRIALVGVMAGYKAAPWEWTLAEFERRGWDPSCAVPSP